MTLLLVFSDTHGDLSLVHQVIAQYPQVTHLLHLGDYVRDAARLAAQYPDRTILAVAGNCDFDADPDSYPAERIVEMDGVRLLMTHGNRFGVKQGYARLAERAKAKSCQLVLFGHTHVAVDMTVDGQHLLNPGSPSQPKGMEGPSFALVEIGHGRIETRLMEWHTPN